MKTTIKSAGKKTLDTVSTTLNKYPWMTITVTGHSSASPGKTCDDLTKGRVRAAGDYLKSKGVKNTMTSPKGQCGKIRAITIANAGGNAAPPANCKA